MRRRFLVIAAAAAVTALASPGVSRADFTTTFSASNTSGLSAEATFQLVGSTLTVTLKNTSTNTSGVNADVLQNLYFKADGITLTSLAATTGANTTLYGPATGSGVTTYLNKGGLDVGGEFAFVNDKAVVAGGAYNYAIASAGRDSGSTSANGTPPDAPFSATSTGVLANYMNPDPNTGTAPDGPTGGLVNGWAPNNTSFGFISNSVVFTFTASGLTSASQITGIAFAYGTSASDPTLTPDGGNTGGGGDTTVPGPAGLILAAGALPFLRLIRRRLWAAPTNAA